MAQRDFRKESSTVMTPRWETAAEMDEEHLHVLLHVHRYKYNEKWIDVAKVQAIYQ